MQILHWISELSVMKDWYQDRRSQTHGREEKLFDHIIESVLYVCIKSNYNAYLGRRGCTTSTCKIMRCILGLWKFDPKVFSLTSIILTSLFCERKIYQAGMWALTFPASLIANLFLKPMLLRKKNDLCCAGNKNLLNVCRSFCVRAVRRAQWHSILVLIQAPRRILSSPKEKKSTAKTPVVRVTAGAFGKWILR